AVNQLEADGLSASEDTSVRHLCQLAVIHFASIPYESFKPAIGIEHDRLDRGAGLGTRRFEAIGRGLQRRGFYLFDLDANCLEHISKVRILKQHTNRADQRRFLRYDMLGRECGDIGARGGKPVDDNDHRLLALQFMQRVVKLLGTGGGPTGTINMYDHGTCARTAKSGEGFDAILIPTD